MASQQPSPRLTPDHLLDPKFVPTLLVMLWLLVLASQVRLLVNRQAPPPTTSTRCSIDPNLASWSELTVLPRIGEVMAHRIVEYRETALATQPPGSGPVFQRVEDLDDVKGIGSKTVSRLRPLLTLPP